MVSFIPKLRKMEAKQGDCFCIRPPNLYLEIRLILMYICYEMLKNNRTLILSKTTFDKQEKTKLRGAFGLCLSQLSMSVRLFFIICAFCFKIQLLVFFKHPAVPA